MVLFFIITSILLVLFIISLYNYLTAPVFLPAEAPDHWNPLVSVLIPARNEEKNIDNVLDSLSMQDYNDFEVIVGNDNSSDSTPALINTYSARYRNIKRIDIPPLPAGWKGKSYALHTITEASGGELLMFIDADVIPGKETIKSAAAYLNSYGADVLSVFPKQVMHTAAERIVVPLLNFFLLSLLPLVQVYRSDKVSLSAGIGQFIVFRRDAYEKTGGHKNVKDKVVEDMELVRSVKRNKLKVLTMLDGGLITCRMYTGLKDAYNGFRKNFYAGTSLSRGAFVILLSVYCITLLLPFVLVFFNILYLIPVLLIIVMRLLISLKSAQGITGILLHPLQIIFMYIIGISSVYPGATEWKGRRV